MAKFEFILMGMGMGDNAQQRQRVVNISRWSGGKGENRASNNLLATSSI